MVTTAALRWKLLVFAWRVVNDRATRQEERQQIFEGFSGILLLPRNRLPQGWQLLGIYGNVRSEEDPGSTYLLARVAEHAETRDKGGSYAFYI
jgi:hypothetical protein